MDPDLSFAIGIVLGVLSIPSIVSALIDGRAPRTPALVIIIAGLLIGYAIQQRPSAYGVDTIFDVLVRVIARYT